MVHRLKLKRQRTMSRYMSTARDSGSTNAGPRADHGSWQRVQFLTLAAPVQGVTLKLSPEAIDVQSSTSSGANLLALSNTFGALVAATNNGEALECTNMVNAPGCSRRIASCSCSDWLSVGRACAMLLVPYKVQSSSDNYMTIAGFSLYSLASVRSALATAEPHSSPSLAPLLQVNTNAPVDCIRFAVSDKVVVAGLRDGTVAVWRLKHLTQGSVSIPNVT